MHFDIFVEDISGKALLDIIVPQMIGEYNTFDVKSYKGCGRIPKDLHTTQDPSKRILLEQLPRILRGLGKTYNASDYDAAVIVVIDCDRRDCKQFKQDLVSILSSCNPKPNAYFRIAIEEMEAWLLGDKMALQTAYPKFDVREYNTYRQDSIIGTWEKLADITLSSKASKALKKSGFVVIGRQKYEWAKKIGIHMNIHNNTSPSFNCLRKKLEELAVVKAAGE
jgi:hypothetical protein